MKAPFGALFRRHKRPQTLVVAGVLGAALAAGCWTTPADPADSSESAITPLDRYLIGQATEYPADPTMHEALPAMRASLTERRSRAWEVVKRVLAPVDVDPRADGGVGDAGASRGVPRFQTWYGKDEILPMFDRLLRGQTAEERAQRKPPTAAQIDEALAWESTRATSLPSWSADRLAQRRAEIEADGPASLGGPERVLMSPAVVRHMYAHYDSILGCIGNIPPPDKAPPSETNFAPCVGEEMPVGSVIVKARWIPDSLPLEAFDTNAAAVTTALTDGAWPAAPRTASPDERGIYTMRLSNGTRMRLAALHIASKELRDWMWITLFWSDTPQTDFGEDRPADLAEPFASYKMCATVAFDEEDQGAANAEGTSLAAAHLATRAFGPRTWCSNPYLEHGANNAKTNCIGCHQHGGTEHTTTTILEGAAAFPDGARAKARANFPADYTFITGTGLELGSLMKAKADQLAGL